MHCTLINLTFNSTPKILQKDESSVLIHKGNNIFIYLISYLVLWLLLHRILQCYTMEITLSKEKGNKSAKIIIGLKKGTYSSDATGLINISCSVFLHNLKLSLTTTKKLSRQFCLFIEVFPFHFRLQLIS